MASNTAGVPDGEFPVPDDVHPTIERVREFIETEIVPFERDNTDHLGGPLSYLGEPTLSDRADSAVQKRTGTTADTNIQSRFVATHFCFRHI